MIKRRRKELKLTQLELAKKLDVSSSAISRYESGEISAMGIDKALALAKALNISPVDLIHTAWSKNKNQDLWINPSRRPHRGLGRRWR